jgi:hypothetical protein
MEVRSTGGRINFFRVHAKGTGYGPPEDNLNDAEVIIRFDQDNQAYGLGLRADDKGPAAQAMFLLLQDAFNANAPVNIEYEYRPGKSSHYLFRVIRKA